MKAHPDLTDTQWQKVAPILEEFRARKDPRGRPPHSPRKMLNGMLWIMSTGSAWSTLPKNYPDYRTCHRRFKVWHASGTLLLAVYELFGTHGLAMYEAITARMRVGRQHIASQESQLRCSSVFHQEVSNNIND
ncbi:transposase [Paraburkholderia aspalathi]|uniref:transposase n=1 Tax=Paraburkholderia aspalathi TaxID=1324617 RepID=UPI0038BBC6E8